jgi:hypothetical protein
MVTLLHLPNPKADILIDNNGSARLSDFSFVTMALDQSASTSTFIRGGAVRWMSPELIDPGKFGFEDDRPTKESDWYALGMVIYEVLSGQRPFAKYRHSAIMGAILGGKRPWRPQGKEGELFTDKIWGTLELCWKGQPQDRISASAVLLCLGGHPPLLRPSFNIDGDANTGNGDDDANTGNGDDDAETGNGDDDAETGYGDDDVETGAVDGGLEMGAVDEDVEIGTIDGDEDVERGNEDEDVERDNEDEDVERGNEDEDVERGNEDEDVERGNEDEDVERGNEDGDVGTGAIDGSVEAGNGGGEGETGNINGDVEAGNGGGGSGDWLEIDPGMFSPSYHRPIFYCLCAITGSVITLPDNKLPPPPQTADPGGGWLKRTWEIFGATPRKIEGH